MRLPRPHGALGWAGTGLAALAVAGALFVFVAPYNIAASMPHLPGVSWLLHTYMQNAVRTWSAGTDRPDWVDLDDPALIRLGASHYEVGCAPCHGAPGRLRNPVALGMRPAPTPLAQAVPSYDAEGLYWLVRNGLKYTGMPAWSGAHRDDEPWAVAAFLLRYPELDAESYARLAYGPALPAEPLAGAPTITFGGLTNRLDTLMKNCARCHGTRGLGREGTAPKLAGQSYAFLASALVAFAEGDRQSGIMEPIAAALSGEEIEHLARHYAGMEPFGADPLAPADAALYARGAELAATGTPEIPSCLACHGEGLSPPRKPIFPRIAGQPRRFLEIWLRLWRERVFGGTEYAHVMHEAAQWLSDDQIEALAVFFAAGGDGSAAADAGGG